MNGREDFIIPDRSAEIRWFDEESEHLSRFFKELVGQSGFSEELRDDLYLNVSLKNTGLKIRDGNCEVKIKQSEDQVLNFGVIENWSKWSMNSEKPFLEFLPEGMRSEWLILKKKRLQKIYGVDRKRKLFDIGDEYLKNGCSIEFTEIYIPSKNRQFFTFAIEGFSLEGRMEECLWACIEGLDVDLNSLLELESFGYPEFLMQISND